MIEETKVPIEKRPFLVVAVSLLGHAVPLQQQD